MQYYTYNVTCDFHSGSNTALDVSCGDVVVGSEKVLKEGTWILVQQSTPPYSHGYVPANYLERAQKHAINKSKSKLPTFIPGVRTIIAKRSRDVIKKLLEEPSTNSNSPGEQPSFSIVSNNEKWIQAIQEYNNGNFVASIHLFKNIPEGVNAKICYNIGVNYRLLSRYEAAIFFFSQALIIDPYFAMAFFSRAHCYQLAGDSFQAAIDYTSVLDMMNMNTYIDYDPLGLPYLLQRASILWNRAICFADCSLFERAIQDLDEIRKCAFSDELLRKTNQLLRELKQSGKQTILPPPSSANSNEDPNSPPAAQPLPDRKNRISVLLDRPILKAPNSSPPPIPSSFTSSSTSSIPSSSPPSMMQIQVPQSSPSGGEKDAESPRQSTGRRPLPARKRIQSAHPSNSPLASSLTSVDFGDSQMRERTSTLSTTTVSPQLSMADKSRFHPSSSQNPPLPSSSSPQSIPSSPSFNETRLSCDSQISKLVNYESTANKSNNESNLSQSVPTTSFLPPATIPVTRTNSGSDLLSEKHVLNTSQPEPVPLRKSTVSNSSAKRMLPANRRPPSVELRKRLLSSASSESIPHRLSDAFDPADPEIVKILETVPEEAPKRPPRKNVSSKKFNFGNLPEEQDM